MQALLLLAALSLSPSARADFIGLPIHCKVLPRVTEDKSEIQVSVMEADGAIMATLQDGSDEATLLCKRVVDPKVPDYHSLECTGSWNSDGSRAELGTPLFTYVPMTEIRRSQAGHGGELQSGICTQD